MNKSRCIFAVSAAVSLLTAAASASAIGLGEIESQSALGQPLNVIVPLSAGSALELEGAVVRIADAAVYRRNGLEKPLSLERAKARILERDGRSYVEVETAAPMREPIMDLLIEIVSLSGLSLQRDYSLLLDPPGYADGSAPATEAATTTLRPSVQDAPPTDSAVTSQPAMTAPAVVHARPRRHRAKTQVHKPARHIKHPARHRDNIPVAVQAQPGPAQVPVQEPVVTVRAPASRTPAPVVQRPAAVVPAQAASPALRTMGQWLSRRISVVPHYLDVRDYAAALLSALLGLAFIAAYRRRKAAPDAEPTAPVLEWPSSPAMPAEPVFEATPAKAVPMPAPRAPEPAEPAVEQGPEQVLDFYRDVAKLLLQELDANPARTDLRYKLLEVYFAAGSKEEFREQTRHYLEQLQGRADQYWHSIVKMGRELLPDSSLYTDAPQLMASETVQELPVAPGQTPVFQRFYEAVNQAKLSGRQAELETAWESLSRDPAFQKAFTGLLGRSVQRPTPLLQAERLGADFGGARIYRKYEDQRAFSDAATINALGQVLLAKHMGKKRVVAASVGGSHGAAVAAAAALLGLDCAIYMRHGDQGRNAERVRRIHDLGASVITVHPSMVVTSDDVRIRALDDWMQDGEGTLYINSVDAGPYPYPSIVQYFQSLVGREARSQMLEAAGRLPDAVITSTADGLSAIGLLQSFFGDQGIALYCIDAKEDSATQAEHRFRREHSWLRASGRVSYVSVDAAEAEKAVADAGRLQDWTLDAAAGEVLVQARSLAGSMGADKLILVMLPKPQGTRAVVMPLRAAS